MSKLHDILNNMQVEEYGTVPQSETEQQIKDLIINLCDEVTKETEGIHALFKPKLIERVKEL